MNSLRDLLQRGRTGNSLLFCGAGFTADCLNFEDDAKLGVTQHLLTILNDELRKNGKQSGYRDVKNAAKRVRSELGIHSLMTLLKSRFQISKVSTSIDTILSYPWKSVYTTNYDDGIEIALKNNRIKYKAINNIEDPNVDITGLPVIHLHGRADA